MIKQFPSQKSRKKYHLDLLKMWLLNMEDPEALDGRLDPLADMLYSTKYLESAGDVIVAN